jgi:hypothetical protein
VTLYVFTSRQHKLKTVHCVWRGTTAVRLPVCDNRYVTSLKLDIISIDGTDAMIKQQKNRLTLDKTLLGMALVLYMNV